MPNVELVTAGVDWLSMTLTDEALQYGEWRNICNQQLYEIANEGYVIEERAMLGYIGFGCANSFVGTLNDRTLVQFSGQHADAAYYKTYREDAHYSRIDLQVTVKFDVSHDTLGKEAEDAANSHNTNVHKGRPRRIEHYAGNDGGFTLYIGSPSSEVRCRLYNKEKQSQDTQFERSWRYEVVYRNEMCDKWRTSVYNAGYEARDVILSIVSDHYRERGVDVRYLGDYPLPAARPIKRSISDDERKLKWLETQVVPTIDYLVNRGYEYDLRELFHRITNDSHYPSCPLVIELAQFVDA